MSDNKEMLNKRKQSLLAELESIKHLLDDPADTIPVLNDTVIEDDIEIPELNTPVTTIADAQVADTRGVLPGQRALFDEKGNAKSVESKVDSRSNEAGTKAPPLPIFSQPENKVRKSSKTPLNENPFLPKHVRQRLDQTAAALAAGESPKPSSVHVDNASYTERLVDQLIAQHLPKIEAELRKKLLEAVKPQNNPKKT